MCELTTKKGPITIRLRYPVPGTVLAGTGARLKKWPDIPTRNGTGYPVHPYLKLGLHGLHSHTKTLETKQNGANQTIAIKIEKKQTKICIYFLKKQ